MKVLTLLALAYLIENLKRFFLFRSLLIINKREQLQTKFKFYYYLKKITKVIDTFFIQPTTKAEKNARSHVIKHL